MKYLKLCLSLLVLPCFLNGQNILWSYKANGSMWEHIRSIKNIQDIDGDNHQDVIAVSENDTLYCLSGMDGNPIWKFVADPCYLERGLIAVPDIDSDSIADVVLATIWGTRSVFAISGASGDTIWQYDTHEYGSGGWVYEVSPMTDMDGDSITDILASTGADPNRAFLLSGATGDKIWEADIGYAVFGIREIGDLNGDTIPDVAISTGDGTPSTYNVFALNGLNGDPIWDQPLNGAGWTVISIGDMDNDTVNDVIAGTMSGEIVAMSGTDGSNIWTKDIGGTVVDINVHADINANGFSELLPSGTTINNFYCIDGLTSLTLWLTPSPDQVFASVSIPDITGDGIDDVACGTGYNTNVFFTLDGISGDTIWYKNMGSPVESCWWLDDIDGNSYPDILVGTREGWIYALGDGNVGITKRKTKNHNGFRVFSIEPTPSSGDVIIKFSVAATSKIELDIYSVTGKRVFANIHNVVHSGKCKIIWDRKDINGKAVPAGVYFVKLKADGLLQTSKLVLIR
jgi:outer membrane protein assembly factor BamB